MAIKMVPVDQHPNTSSVFCGVKLQEGQKAQNLALGSQQEVDHSKQVGGGLEIMQKKKSPDWTV